MKESMLNKITGFRLTAMQIVHLTTCLKFSFVRPPPHDSFSLNESMSALKSKITSV